MRISIASASSVANSIIQKIHPVGGGEDEGADLSPENVVQAKGETRGVSNGVPQLGLWSVAV